MHPQIRFQILSLAILLVLPFAALPATKDREPNRCDTYLVSLPAWVMKSATWPQNNPENLYSFETVWSPKGYRVVREKLTGVSFAIKERIFLIELPYEVQGLRTSILEPIPKTFYRLRIFGTMLSRYFDLHANTRAGYNIGYSPLVAQMENVELKLLEPVTQHLFKQMEDSVSADSQIKNQWLHGELETETGVDENILLLEETHSEHVTSFVIDGQLNESFVIYTTNHHCPDKYTKPPQKVTVNGAIGIQILLEQGYFQYNVSFPEKDLYLSGMQSFATLTNPSTGKLVSDPLRAIAGNLPVLLEQASTSAIIDLD